MLKVDGMDRRERGLSMYVVFVSVVQPRESHLFRRMQSILFIFSLGRVRNSSISMSMSVVQRGRGLIKPAKVQQEQEYLEDMGVCGCCGNLF